MNYSFIGREVASLTCKVHHRHPQVVTHSHKIQIKCCCEDFRSEISGQIPAIVDAYIRQTLDDAFKKR